MLVVTQFGINATKENLIRFVQISERSIWIALDSIKEIIYSINRMWSSHSRNITNRLSYHFCSILANYYFKFKNLKINCLFISYMIWILILKTITELKYYLSKNEVK